MFNYQAIDKTPTVVQIEAIIKYMSEDPNEKYNFTNMMGMTRPQPNVIHLDLNDAHWGNTYLIVFKNEGLLNEIERFEKTGSWMS